MEPLNKSKKNHWIFIVCYFVTLLRRRVKRTRYRRNLLEEWIEKEQRYIRILQATLEHIKKPMLEQELIGRTECLTLFPEFQGIKGLSQNLLNILCIVRRQRSPNKILLGDALQRLFPFYKLYGTYFSCYIRSGNILKTLEATQPEQMNQIKYNLQEAMKEYEKLITVSDCLEKPNNWMFKYLEFMTPYLKKLPKTHPDWPKMKGALQMFQKICFDCQDVLMTSRRAEKKKQLDQLFGRSIDTSSEYLLDESADTLYFSAKIYLFSNVVCIAKVDSGVQKYYTHLKLNQFSFVHFKPNLKYFRNGLILCGENNSLHFFFSDPGIRLAVYKNLSSVINQVRRRASNRRQQTFSKPESAKTLQFIVCQGTDQDFCLRSELRIEVIDVQIRPLSKFSNDTIYVTRFMLPNYLQDDIVVDSFDSSQTQQSEETLQKAQYICQIVEVHLSQIVQLHSELKEEYPEHQIPDIDPFTKEINLFTEGKKNTKVYQVRRFLLEQFFNFIFRHPVITKNAIRLAKKNRIISALWEYACEKNDYLLNGDTKHSLSRKNNPEPQKHNLIYKYDETNCSLCRAVPSITSVQQFETLRRKCQVTDTKECCMNFFSLIRLKLLKLRDKQSGYLQFDTLERVLLFAAYYQGRLDYLLLPRQRLPDLHQSIKIYVQSLDKQTALDIPCDVKTKVGEILADFAADFGVDHLLDYRIVLQYSDKVRILDQDEFILDVVRKFELECIDQEYNSRRSSLTSAIDTSGQSFFSFLKNIIGVGAPAGKLYLKKIIFLAKQLELRSIERSGERAKLIIGEIFVRIARLEIRLDLEKWGELTAYFSVLKNINIGTESLDNKLEAAAKLIIPQQKQFVIKNKIFVAAFVEGLKKAKTLQEGKSVKESDMTSFFNSGLIFLNQAPVCKFDTLIYKECLKISYNSILTYTYMTSVLARIVPQCLVLDELGPIEGECILGVNFKELVVLRGKGSNQQSVRLSLEDVELIVSTFSVFVNYKSYTDSGSSVSGSVEQKELRFDSKMMHSFSELMNTYKLLRIKFPQYQK